MYSECAQSKGMAAYGERIRNRRKCPANIDKTMEGSARRRVTGEHTQIINPVDESGAAGPGERVVDCCIDIRIGDG